MSQFKVMIVSVFTGVQIFPLWLLSSLSVYKHTCRLGTVCQDTWRGFQSQVCMLCCHALVIDDNKYDNWNCCECDWILLASGILPLHTYSYVYFWALFWDTNINVVFEMIAF